MTVTRYNKLVYLKKTKKLRYDKKRPKEEKSTELKNTN